MFHVKRDGTSRFFGVSRETRAGRGEDFAQKRKRTLFAVVSRETFWLRVAFCVFHVKHMAGFFFAFHVKHSQRSRRRLLSLMFHVKHF